MGLSTVSGPDLFIFSLKCYEMTLEYNKLGLVILDRSGNGQGSQDREGNGLDEMHC
jgi:hypothetical protein